MAESPLTWLRSGDSPLPVAVRSARRAIARTEAVLRHGTIIRHMEHVVAGVAAPLPAVTGIARTSPPRIVEVSTYPLHPRQSGGQLRGWHLAEALGHDGSAEVVIVSLTTDPGRGGTHQLAPHVVEHCVVLPTEQLRREARLRLVTGDVAITDIAAGLMWPGIDGFGPVLRSALDGAAAAVLVQPYLVDAVRHLAPGLPIVCDAHNDEVVLKRSILPANTAGAWMLHQVDDLERRAVEHAALLTATTERDLGTLGGRYDITAPTAVVPNGVDTHSIEFVSGNDRESRAHGLAAELGLSSGRPSALFVGSGHLPNIDAGRDIIEVARSLPGVDFLLAGQHSTLLHVQHLPDNVRILGVVSDDLLDRLLAACSIALNPMHTGSGSNLKLLSYLAAGIPVVSTPVGARGVDVAEAGVQLTTEDDLAGGIEGLLADDSAARALAGRRYVEEHCDWRAIGRRFAELTAPLITT